MVNMVDDCRPPYSHREHANTSGYSAETVIGLWTRSRPANAYKCSQIQQSFIHEGSMSCGADGLHKKQGSTSALVSGLTTEQVEPWQPFPYLKHGYRRGGCYLECCISLFSFHNETVNAWTTLLSVLMGMVLFANTVSNLRCSWLDFSPFHAAWIGQTLHGPLSCGYHTFMCMTILVGCAAALGIRSVAALQPKQQLDRRRIVGMIGLTCAGYYLPLVVRGVAALALQDKLWPEFGIALVVLGCHFTGALVYATHWPQRHFPGVFDLAGFSHNLMHILCFTAYNCVYPYLSYLYSQRDEWAVTSRGIAEW